ncbi:putative sugar kinase YdjH [Dyadobacter sp. CECT 9275]|uniref:Sugar kinase YdjH n=1 Tax=Dyadobacter helix TaxID=2822344 RepID=A0A916JCB2_9BACT|nr:carbohydrate kinase family protein [Dyadobacter sp. CECT 9275]CAG5000852.1 putative sugar kinase YdjH [Dyadobacter sp. CECT 9275]
MKDFDVSVIGELNIDFILNQIDSFPEIGKEILSRQMNVTLGSSSAIFASNLSSLDTKVAFIGKVGQDSFGELILATLKNKHVNTDAILRREDLKTGATVVLNFGEDRAMITHPGAMEDLAFTDIDWATVGRSRHLHLSSFFIQKGIRKDVPSIFKKAKEIGLTTSFDPQWDPGEEWQMDLEGILPYVDIFLPNKKELLHLTGHGSLQSAVRHIKSLANTIVVKLGNEGSALFTPDGEVFQPAFLNTDVVDAIGAGDSFNAGFIHKFVGGHPLPACQEFGNMIGAYSTTASGGTGAFSAGSNIHQNVKERFGYAEKQHD